MCCAYKVNCFFKFLTVTVSKFHETNTSITIQKIFSSNLQPIHSLQNPMNEPHCFHQWTISIIWENTGFYMLLCIVYCKIKFFPEITTLCLQFKNFSLSRHFSSSHSLAVLRITTAAAQQPEIWHSWQLLFWWFPLLKSNKQNLPRYIPECHFHFFFVFPKCCNAVLSTSYTKTTFNGFYFQQFFHENWRLHFFFHYETRGWASFSLWLPHTWLYVTLSTRSNIPFQQCLLVCLSVCLSVCLYNVSQDDHSVQ